MAKNYILNVKDTNGNWVPLQTLVGPKGDQGVQGPVGVGIKNITKENENLIITLTNDQRKELDLNITNTLNTIFSNRISQEINDKLSKGNVTSDITAETLKRDIDLNSGKIRNNELSLTKTANELKIENNIIKYKENNVNKTIDLTPYINPTNQAIESIVQSKGQTLFESKDATIVKNLELINKKLTFNSNGVEKEINLPILDLPRGNELLNKINNDITNTSPEFISFKDKLNIPTSLQQILIENDSIFQNKSFQSKNLDDYKDQNKQGYFIVKNNSEIQNLPISKNGIIKIFALNDSYTLQEYVTIDGEIYQRIFNNTWGNWKLLNPIVVDKTNKTIHFGENKTDLYSVYVNNINAKSKIITQDEIISSGDITAFSDIRLKTNIEKIENALDKVCQLSGYTYDMNDKRRTGVIAQEVEKVLPEVVQNREDGYKTIAYGNMIGLLIEAIKELKEEIKVIKNGN
jgi:putative yapH protein